MAILILCTRMLDQSNLSTQRCLSIFWVECSAGGYLVLAKTIHITVTDKSFALQWFFDFLTAFNCTHTG
jgi:hypothetical protein